LRQRGEAEAGSNPKKEIASSAACGGFLAMTTK